jgi:hypothetical protein
MAVEFKRMLERLGLQASARDWSMAIFSYAAASMHFRCSTAEGGCATWFFLTNAAHLVVE